MLGFLPPTDAARGLTVQSSGTHRVPLQRVPAWTRDAACSGMDAGMWDGDEPHLTAAARRVCDGCPVLRLCLERSVHESHGVIAGLTAPERAALVGITRADAKRPAHGTRSRYIGSRRHPGCRCGACHAAHATYERTMRAKRKAARGESAYTQTPLPVPRIDARGAPRPHYARITFEYPEPQLLATIERAHSGRLGLMVQVWQQSGIVVEHAERVAADNVALAIADSLEETGVPGWTLHDAAGNPIHSVGVVGDSYTPGDFSPGWWTRAGLPWPGEQWRHFHADLLRRTLMSAPLMVRAAAAA